jgi:hypothetical protein
MRLRLSLLEAPWMYQPFSEGEDEDGGQQLPLVRGEEEASLSRVVHRPHRIVQVLVRPAYGEAVPLRRALQ